MKLTELYNNQQVTIIMASSEADVEAKYNQMMDDAKKIGLEKLETYMTDKYKEAKAKYESLE